MTREILLPATSGRISVTQFDVLDSDRPRDAACDKRDVCQGRAVLRLERDARGKAEANLALCGEVDAVLTPAHPGRLRSSPRRAAKNHPIFRNSRRPRGGLGAHDTRQYAGRHRVCRRVDGHIDYLPTLLKSSILRSPGVLPREGAIRLRLSRRPPVSTSQALTRHGKSNHEPFWLPVARDFSSQLAGRRRANEKVSKSCVANG